ncbi:MAG: HIT family hydrolase [Acidimicrobiales bacterium mtb01]|nr:HIT domain-containing protein [Actinomycetota bacterium]TEX45218.1 MAG: HIT family hydrolase [Acidimicrobiales bacterium mtb01]
MHEALWAGWRSRYLEDRAPSDRSVFREIIESGRPDEETLVVWRGSTVFALMNLHPYTVGHLLVLPYRQTSELHTLTPDEHRELWDTVVTATRVIEDEYRPAGINIGANLGPAAGGSVRNHVHVHVVPRWIGDGNFLAATASTRQLPEALDVTADRLRRSWVRVAGRPKVGDR